MKKHLVIIVVSTIWFALPLSALSRTVEVGVLVDFISEDSQPLFEQLRSEIIAVVGNDAKIEMGLENTMQNNFDSELAAQNYQKMVSSSTDIILAFGPTNSNVISRLRTHKKPTILFGALSSELVDIDLSKEKSGINNFTYIVTPLSYRKDLQDFHSIYPFKKIAIIGFGPWINQRVESVFASIFESYQSDYQLLSYSSVDQFADDISGFDSVYFAEGFGVLQSDLGEMADLLIERAIPGFITTGDAEVKRGWLATNQTQANVDRIFRRIALSVDATITGENLSQRPIYVDFADTITVNYNTAERIDVPLRLSQLATTNLVGSFTELIADQKLTVFEAVELALKENLALQSSAIDVNLAEQDLANAKSSYAPDVSLSASKTWRDPDVARLSNGQSPERTTAGSLGVSQLLYSEDSNAAISIQRRLLSAQTASFRASELDTVASTSSACFNLLRLKNNLRSQAENLEITKRNLAVAQQNFDAGRSGKADIFRFESELATNLQNVFEAINSYRQSQYNLNSILNLPISTRIDIIDARQQLDQFEPDDFSFERLQETLDHPREQEIFEDFLVDQAYLLSPEIIQLENNVKAAERNLAQYGWRRYIPTVTASAQYNEVFDRSGAGQPDPNFALDDDYNLGLVFSVPIFNRNSDNIEQERAKQQLQQLTLQLDNQEQAVETRVRAAVLDVSNSVTEIELSSVSEKAAQQSLELIEASYRNGAVTITELIDAQNAYLQAQLASANAYYNFLERAIAMERSVGSYIFLEQPGIDRAQFVQLYNEYRKKQQSTSQ